MTEFESCDMCKYNEKSETEYPCNQCVHNAMDMFKPMTRADKIRSMSDEELAVSLPELINFARETEYCAGVKDWLKWLQSEAE